MAKVFPSYSQWKIWSIGFNHRKNTMSIEMVFRIASWQWSKSKQLSIKCWVIKSQRYLILQSPWSPCGVRCCRLTTYQAFVSSTAPHFRLWNHMAIISMVINMEPFYCGAIIHLAFNRVYRFKQSMWVLHPQRNCLTSHSDICWMITFAVVTISCY